MIKDHYEAAWRHLNKMTVENEDRVEILEFANVIYKAADQMWPLYKYLQTTLRAIEMSKYAARDDNTSTFEAQVPEMEDFAKEVFRLYTNSGHEQTLLPREVPKGTMEALDEVLQDEATNFMVIERGNPYKNMYQWSHTEPAIKKHTELVDAIEAERASVEAKYQAIIKKV